MRRDMIDDLPAPAPIAPYHIGIAPLSWIPHILGAIEQRKGFWLYQDSDAAKSAYAILTEVQMSFLTDAYNGLTRPTEQLYRLLDTTLNGEVYTSEVIDSETVITPAIPPVPEPAAAAMALELDRLTRIAGTGLLSDPQADPTLPSTGAVELLTEIRDNILADDVDLDEIVSGLSQVLALLA